MMGDYISDPQEFWNFAIRKCNNDRAGGLFVFDSFQGDLHEAVVPQKKGFMNMYTV